MGARTAGSPGLDLLERATQVTRGLVERMVPDDLERATPCDEYDVRGLLEHLIGWQQVFAACATGGAPALADGSPTYTASAHLSEDLAAASTALIESLRHRRDASITLPYRGVTSVELLVDELLAETVIHTWDLAIGLGASVVFDDEMVAAAHIGLSKLLDEPFAETGFRPARGSVASGTDLDRLLERSGRQVAT